jgi:hypothetical protein
MNSCGPVQHANGGRKKTPRKARRFFNRARELTGGLDLVADYAANCRAANYANRAAAGQYAADNCTSASADCGVTVLLGHASATGQAECNCNEGSANNDLFN